jgi:hypothetical protein
VQRAGKGRGGLPATTHVQQPHLWAVPVGAVAKVYSHEVPVGPPAERPPAGEGLAWAAWVNGAGSLSCPPSVAGYSERSQAWRPLVPYCRKHQIPSFGARLAGNWAGGLVEAGLWGSGRGTYAAAGGHAADQWHVMLAQRVACQRAQYE